ncbi:MAG: polysaccharide biosynthesis/export family protein [Candidatus Omnitrophica bacterium]|nr:polysaccharide biosynthesis/export family protein [Candidatus Omnitrophota bacterium]
MTKKKLILIIVMFVLLSGTASGQSETESKMLYVSEKKLILNQLKTVTEYIDTRIKIFPQDLITIVYKDHGQIQKAVYPVSANGEIFIPLIGTFKISGLNRRQTRDMINSTLQEYIRDPNAQIAINLEEKYCIIGAVGTPSTYKFKSGIKIMDTLLNIPYDRTEANLNSVILIRGTTKKSTIMKLDLNKMIKRGDQSDNVVLKPGDIIFIPNEIISNFEIFKQEILPDILSFHVFSPIDQFTLKPQTEEPQIKQTTEILDVKQNEKLFKVTPEIKNILDHRPSEKTFEFQTQMLELDTHLKKIDEQINQLNNGNIEQTVKKILAENPKTINLKNQLLNLEFNRFILLLDDTEKHPDVLSIDATIKDVKQKIVDTIKTYANIKISLDQETEFALSMKKFFLVVHQEMLSGIVNHNYELQKSVTQIKESNPKGVQAPIPVPKNSVKLNLHFNLIIGIFLGIFLSLGLLLLIKHRIKIY